MAINMTYKLKRPLPTIDDGAYYAWAAPSYRG